ncbi:glycerophosphodiester phosphodiesterase [Candidatus Laterigemmans baculatus]|uniref:glycerophosphodiester phosphodiesterase n=1 Tax=Candidatus Laterigemmans baculatus TaxID=2770505 RepID=UPI001F47886F|nr:glycerophosphodiester phosphodiesterase [Candidatus Laterigemmans baculatus]
MKSCKWIVSALTILGATLGLNGEASGQAIVAHRGASHDAPENTMAAFELAWEQGADGIEGDFHLTSDGHIVCIHDADTERVSGVKRVVAKTPLKTLREMEVGRWKGPEWEGEPIPTFAEVLSSIPEGKQFFIELKTGPEIVEPLVEQLRGFKGDRNQLTIICFKEDTIRRCSELLPDIKAHWLTSFKRENGGPDWRPQPQKIAGTIEANGAEGVGMQGRREVLVPAFFAELRKAGAREFHVWTIDDPEDARFFQAQGAYGITTNRPALIRESLQSGS